MTKDYLRALCARKGFEVDISKGEYGRDLVKMSKWGIECSVQVDPYIWTLSGRGDLARQIVKEAAKIIENPSVHDVNNAYYESLVSQDDHIERMMRGSV